MIYDVVNKVSQTYRNNLKLFIFGPLLKVIEAVFDLLIPLIMKSIIDLVIYENTEAIPNSLSRFFAILIRSINNTATPLSDALTGGGIILVMGVVGYMITMTAQYMAAVASVNVGSEVRSSLYNKVLHLSKKEREQVSNSKLLTLINSDSYQLQQGVLLFVRLIIRVPVILIGSLIFSFILDWRVGLAFLAVVPLIILVNFIILRKSSKEYISIQKDLDDISNSTSEVTDGSRVIRASNNEQFENDKFNVKTNSYENKSIKVNRINALINPLTFAITSLVLIVIIFLLKDNLFTGDATFTSTIIAEMSYLAQIFFVTVQITQATIDIVKAHVSSKRINSVLSIKESITNIEEGKTNEVGDKEAVIKFKDVSFSFNGDNNYFIENLSFEVRKGETFAIIGGTGSGKSTIANLIERFYDVDKGEILYNNIPLKEYDLESLRKDIGLVNQKSSLFKGTINSNYLMANINASDEDINTALSLAEASEFINKYEDTINHEVKEGGVNFSGGQRQRLCIGRALVKNPKILILDDATSALDLLTDKKIRTNISNFKNMTKIIISQRVSTIQNADYILVLEGGKVVGLGTHDKLLKTCPIYLEIYQTQIKKE